MFLVRVSCVGWADRRRSLASFPPFWRGAVAFSIPVEPIWCFAFSILGGELLCVELNTMTGISRSWFWSSQPMGASLNTLLVRCLQLVRCELCAFLVCKFFSLLASTLALIQHFPFCINSFFALSQSSANFCLDLLGSSSLRLGLIQSYNSSLCN